MLRNLVSCCVVALALSPCSFAADPPSGDELVAQGVAKVLEGILSGDRKPLTPDEAKKLVESLDDGRFKVREAATARLKLLPFPPLGQLREAQKSTSEELSKRAGEILTYHHENPNPNLGVLEAILKSTIPAKIRLEPKELYRLAELSAEGSLYETVTLSIMTSAKAGDLDLAKKMFAKENPLAVRATALRVIASIEKKKSLDLLKETLKDKETALRVAAARALVETSGTLEKEETELLKGMVKELDPETAVIVYQVMEYNLREKNPKGFKDPEAAKAHSQITAAYGEILDKVKGVTKKMNQPANTQYWLEQGMDTSKNPEVLAYRIKWFSGQWSGWYIPGSNDKLGNDERNIRCWACFNDHEFEVITTTRKELYRKVLDLPE